MKIVVLMGSPNINGSTSMLVQSFRKGAEEKGHSVCVIDVCKLNIAPCTGCVACGYEGDCVQRDDNELIRQKLLGCDMVVFATPLYYYGMSAQLKIVVDRFCAYNSSLNRRHLKSALLTVAWNSDDWTFEALVTYLSGHLLPAFPVLFVETVLDGDDLVLVYKALPVSNELI